VISRQAIEDARAVIQGHVQRTPVVVSHTLSRLCDCHTLFKLENLQMTGSFKDRGALVKLMSLSEEERGRGVVAASAGNHAQGVAYHAQRLGIPAKIVMPLWTPLIKVVSTQNYGAETVLFGETYDDAEAHAWQIAKEEERVFVHPFDDPAVIAGQGTIAAEVLEEPLCQNLGAILCPVGGGGLISGIATYIKETRPEVKVIGVEAAACPSMKEALERGAPYRLAASCSLADGIAVKQVGRLTYGIASRYVDDVVAVEEDEIANAVLLFLEIEKILVEGAGAVPLAALLARKVSLEGQRVLSIVSGGNMDVNILSRIITRGLRVDGRIMEFRVRLRDLPGSLNDVLTKVKELQANILDVSHHRYACSAPIGYVDISITLETKGHQHVAQIESALGEYRV